MIVDYMPEVERLFAEAPDRFEKYVRSIPVIGGLFFPESINEAKERLCRALRAYAWFEKTRPRDAWPWPRNLEEYEDLTSRGGLSHIAALFIASLTGRDYAFDEHPSFDDFARGVLASPHAPDVLKQDKELLELYPPRHLPGLGSFLSWDPVR